MKLALTILISVSTFVGFSQSFINGSFENHSVGGDSLNLDSSGFNTVMSNCTSFGTIPNIDLLTSNAFCGSGADDGSWYIGITGSGTDAIALELDSALQIGVDYTLTFSERFCDPFVSYTPHALEIGLSNSDTTFGTLIYTGSVPTVQNWVGHTVDFTAPVIGMYITVRLAGGSTTDTWTHIDNFSMTSAPPPTSASALLANSILLYPNPAKNVLNVAGLQANTQVEVISFTGQLLYRKVSSRDKVEINLYDYPVGSYLVRIIQKNGVSATKLVIRVE